MARWAGAHRSISWILVVGLCCLVATLAFPDTADISGAIGIVLLFASAGVVFLRRAAMLDGRERLAWSGIGVACLSAATGVILIAALNTAGVVLPAFGLLDGFFICSYLLLASSIVAMPHAEGRWSVRVLGLVDGLVGAVALATVSWVWFLGDYLHQLQAAPVTERVIAMAYPILDVAILISLLMLSLRRSTFRFDRRLLLVSLALIGQTVADISYASSGVGELFAAARPLYALNVLVGGFLLATASIVEQRPELQEYADRPAGWASLVAPYGAAVVMVGGLIFHAVRSEAENVSLLALGTVLVALLTFARQSVAIREYRFQVDDDRQKLVSSISHELRTPLTPMVGMLEMLRSQGENLTRGEREEFLDIVTDQARYMSRIVTDLILLARDNNETLQIEPSPHELDALVRSAVGHVQGGEGTIVEVPSIAVEVDGDRIQQAVANLLANAIKYGGRTVMIRGLIAGENVVIEVHDDGEGVPIKYEIVIWDRFERGPRNLDSRVPGSGIGLAVVAEVAKAHGGFASYRRSELLGGSCFYFLIPATAASRARIARVATGSPITAAG
ncbi:MAG: sensor histidine kinase [Acidimicrobiia bacterium]